MTFTTGTRQGCLPTLRAAWQVLRSVCVAAAVAHAQLRCRGLNTLAAMVLLVLAAMGASVSSAQAVCDQTVNSTSGATINFTSIGQVYHLCLTVVTAGAGHTGDDAVVYGLYSMSGTDALNQLPIAGTSTSAYSDFSPTTSRASYKFSPKSANDNGQNANSGNAQIDITLNSVTTFAQDSVTLYYAPSCSDALLECTGDSHATTPWTFTINLPTPPPTVTSISPTSGPAGGGTSVIITGTNLSGATAVTFGPTAATGITINSPTQITATSPTGSGTVDVTVTTAGGTSATSVNDRFTYIAAPTVTSVSPNSGPAAGGTTVTIVGTGFIVGASTVSFGGTPATGVTVNSTTSITATSPAGGTGTIDVTVTTAGGTSATSANDRFTY
uniref:IPT/TIG domain-containing protein n=1 Tax=Tardiphaga sp. TaxID=1926292 RepID=UPI0025D7B112